MHPKLHIMHHPLVYHKLTKIRDKKTGPKEFKEFVEELATIICYEATRNIQTEDTEIETPVQKTKGKIITQEFAVVPILRAGQGMLNGILRFLPTAKVGHIGLYRDPSTLIPVQYYVKLPTDIALRQVFIIDPMIATGNSVKESIKILIQNGVLAKNIKILCLVSCPEGVQNIHGTFGDVEIYTATHDVGLNEKGYILPGLGDAGDRLYGTQ